MEKTGKGKRVKVVFTGDNVNAKFPLEELSLGTTQARIYAVWGEQIDAQFEARMEEIAASYTGKCPFSPSTMKTIKVKEARELMNQWSAKDMQAEMLATLHKVKALTQDAREPIAQGRLETIKELVSKFVW